MTGTPRIVATLVGLVLVLTSACVAPKRSAPLSGIGSLTVRVAGFASKQGAVRLALFDSDATWLQTTAHEGVLDLRGPVVTWTVEDLPLGAYAVAVFHDENGNGVKDANALGMPTEPYGFSNDARRVIGPATWKEASFDLAGPHLEIEIEVK